MARKAAKQASVSSLLCTPLPSKGEAATRPPAWGGDTLGYKTTYVQSELERSSPSPTYGWVGAGLELRYHKGCKVGTGGRTCGEGPGMP